MNKQRDEFPTPEAWHRFYVSYGETDAAGVVYYGEYLHWFERARGRLIRDRGMSYADVEARGVLLPVRRAETRYIRPARYDEEISVRCAVSAWGRASVTFTYQVWGPPDRSVLLAVGETEHAAIGPDWKPLRIPDWLKALFTV